MLELEISLQYIRVFQEYYQSCWVNGRETLHHNSMFIFSGKYNLVVEIEGDAKQYGRVLPMISGACINVKIREFEIADSAETFIKEKCCDVARRRRRKIWTRTGIWENLESRTEPPLGVGGGVLRSLSI